MKLRLIEGGAGSGKTRTCLEEIAAKLQREPIGAPLLLLVPEQATFQAERALTQMPGVSASLRAQAVGFAGLYRMLGGECDFPVLPRLDDQGRSMLLLACLRETADNMKVLRGVKGGSIGLIDSTAEALVEFEQYRISPDDLQKTAGRVSNELLGGRLSDLALIYRTYLAKIAGGFRDQGVMMEELAAAAAKSRLLLGAELWLDGFLDLNPSQMAVIAAILPGAKAVNVCLCLPDKGRERIFERQKRLANKLKCLAAELGAEVSETRLLHNWRHDANPELLAIEEAFATGGIGRKTDSDNKTEIDAKTEFYKRINADSSGRVQLFSAGDPHGEVVAAARIINRLCSGEGGCKFREVAVITRDISDYRVELNNVFRDFGIPFFLDMGTELNQHPVLKLLHTALAVLSENWSLNSVLAYLKSGLSPITAEEADILDNYLRRVGIRGYMWRKVGSWQRGDAAELPLINELAARAAAPLLHMEEKLPGEPVAADMVRAIFELMAELNVADRLEEWQRRATADGELRLADAHRQILPQVERLLGQIADFLGDMPGDAARFDELLSEGAARLELSSIPPSLNEVTVAEVSRSRLPEIKAAIVLGLNDGVMPLVTAESGFFNSAERQELARLGLKLAPGGREQQFLEDYYIYTALTRSSEKLYLLYSRQGADGAARQPSSVLHDLKRVLPGLDESSESWETHAGKEPGLISMLGGDRLLLSGLTEHLARLKAGEAVDAAEDRFWRRVCKQLAAEGKLQQGIRMLTDGLAYRADKTPLDRRRMGALYPRMDSTSVSRLEKFNNCPCQYYANYGLGLRPREEFKLRTLDIGNLYHYLLAEVMHRLAVRAAADGESGWSKITQEAVESLVIEVLNEFVEGDANWAALLSDSAKNAYARQKMTAVVSRSVLDMAAAFAMGKFRPVAFELDFGFGSKLGPVMIELPDGRKISLRGKIDRIDAAEGVEAEFIRVVDYKTKNKTLELADVYYGLNWQLPLYLEALLQNGRRMGRKLAPAGMFYIPVQEIIKSVKKAGESGDAVRFQGLAILDIEALTLAERDMEPGKSAKTMQVHIKKDNTYGSKTRGLTAGEYGMMQTALQRMVRDQLDRMLSGEIRQQPIAEQGREICERCDYYPLCALDRAVESDVRQIEKISTQEAMRRIAAEYPAEYPENKNPENKQAEGGGRS